MDAIAVIPARLGSTRLARKVLRDIAGRPMLAHVYQAARASRLLRDVVVATDAEEVQALCVANGWTCKMTSAAHRSGTDRVHEVAGSIAAEVYVNIQGDEPMVRAEHLGALLALMNDPSVLVGTLKTPLVATEAQNPNVAKVVTDLAGRALYFSRSAIPFDRDGAGVQYFKHLGLYAYREPALDKFCALPESSLERSERLEQLRFMENGIAIHVAETPYDTVSVDTEDDLKRVEALLRG